MSKIQVSAAERSIFRELNGPEFLQILVSEVMETLNPRLKWTKGFTKEAEEGLKGKITEQLEKSNRFMAGNSYPVVGIHGVFLVRTQDKQLAFLAGSLRVKVLPLERDPRPLLLQIAIPFTGAEGEAAEKTVDFHLEVGTTIDNHPDKLREKHGIEVKQPKRLPDGWVRNAVVLK